MPDLQPEPSVPRTQMYRLVSLPILPDTDRDLKIQTFERILANENLGFASFLSEKLTPYLVFGSKVRLFHGTKLRCELQRAWIGCIHM